MCYWADNPCEWLRLKSPKLLWETLWTWPWTLPDLRRKKLVYSSLSSHLLMAEGCSQICKLLSMHRLPYAKAETKSSQRVTDACRRMPWARSGWCVHSGDGQSTRSICYLRYVSGPVKDRNHTVILDIKNYYLWRMTSKKDMKENANE